MKEKFKHAYDIQFKEIEHFKNYPEMMPFVGRNYEDTKVLFIGESHFLNGAILFEKTPKFENQWYNQESSQLPLKQNDSDPNFLGAIYTREVLDDFMYGSSSKSYRIFSNLAAEMQDCIAQKSDNARSVFENVAFYNYYQRPAFSSGDSIEDNEEDNEKAYSVYKEVVQILQPKKVIFVSSKAASIYKYYKSRKYRDTDGKMNHPEYDSVSHPGSSWWNRRSKNYGENVDGTNRTGREKFKWLIEEAAKG
jgi:hypothetical protein